MILQFYIKSNVCIGMIVYEVQEFNINLKWCVPNIHSCRGFQQVKKITLFHRYTRMYSTYLTFFPKENLRKYGRRKILLKFIHKVLNIIFLCKKGVDLQNVYKIKHLLMLICHNSHITENNEYFYFKWILKIVKRILFFQRGGWS